MLKQEETYSSDYPIRHNTIIICGEINEQMAREVISQLLFLENKGVDEITLQINSPGGLVSAGLAIYDVLNSLRARIVTVGLGVCASMGAFLLSSGSRGYRRAGENCEVLIHQPLGGAQGQATDIINAANHISRTRDKLNRILSENTGRTIREIERDTDRDNYMSAEQALEYGLIDEIIPSWNKAAKVKEAS